MNDLNNHAAGDAGSGTLNRTLRIVTAAIIGAIVASYTAAVLAGAIAPVRQLSTANLVLLAVVGGLIAVILRPETFREISSISAAGVQFDLNHVQNRQRELQNLLNEIFPLLLPSNVLKHLRFLGDAERGLPIPEYKGTDPLRQELRQLRYMGLIQLASPHSAIGQIPDGRFKLPEYIELTKQGRHWIDLAQHVEGLAQR